MGDLLNGCLMIISDITNLRMIVSVSTISFRDTENFNALYLENTTDRFLIFKLKITNTVLFSIAPGKGVSAPHQKVLVSIKLNRLADVSAKLLVCYAQLDEGEEGQGQSIDQQWAKIDKERHQNIVIPITRTTPKEQHEKKEERPTFKKTESPIYEMEINSEEKDDLSGSSCKRAEPALKQSLTLKNSTSMFRSVEDLDKREVNSKKLQSQRYERELKQEREKNRKMERLIEREKKIMYLTDMRQLEINRSHNRNEEENVWTCCNVVLGAFLFLLLGFLLSKYELPTDVAKKWL